MRERGTKSQVRAGYFTAMMSNQQDASTLENNETVHPNQQSATESRAGSVSNIHLHEDAFVSGALGASEDGSEFQTASRRPSQSIKSRSTNERTSLEALEQAPSVAHVTLPENEDAISTALPNSNDEDLLWGSTNSNTNVNGRSQPQESSLQEPVKSYASDIETLSLYLPHLYNVKGSSRHKKVSVTCYDYIGDALATVKAFSVMRLSDDLPTADGTSLGQYLENVPPTNLRLRLIVATDLSSHLIECLGTSFSMSPEIFEEHLVNSGWQNGMYNDAKPDTWITRDMKKTHISIKWYRPVKRVLQRPHSTVDRQRFLDPGAKSFSWTEAVPTKVGKPHGVDHVTRSATNILRRDWDIKTDAEEANTVGGFAAWEERATVWIRQRGDYHVGKAHISSIHTEEQLIYDKIVLLLLDPLPIVSDEMRGATEALRKLGVDHTKPPTKGQVTKKGPAGKVSKEAWKTEQSQRGLVRSTTFVRYQPKTDQNFSIRSLGRLIFGSRSRRQDSSRDGGPSTGEQLAADPESGGQNRESQQKITGISRPKARTGVPKIIDRLFRRSRKKPEKVNRAEEVDVLEEEEGTEIKTLRPMDRCMFEGLYPRGPAVDYDFLMDPKNVDFLAEHLDRTKSTAANYAEWLTNDDRGETLKIETLTHLEYLFAIIQSDTMNTLRHMELALQEIGQHILDDTLIQQRLVHWRLLLERFGTELQQLEDSLRRFAAFIRSFGSRHDDRTENSDKRISPVDTLLGDCVSQINSLHQRTTRSHKSLMANMSIVESKRGIAEAESVTKLTELAFFFIPLTFSASIFSMQVKELDASRVSIAAFFILAIVITFASYALRLLIRSESFIGFRTEFLRDIRQDAGLASSSSIPTMTFLAWTWRRVGLLTVIVTILVALLVIPIAVLWTRDMNHGFKVLLTLLLLAFILAASYVTGNAMLYIDARGLHLRRDIFKPGVKSKERPSQRPFTFSGSLAFLFSWLTNRWSLIALAMTGVFAGPAAALWTSHLTTGIKVGITIALAVLYIGAVVLILLNVVKSIN